MVPSSYEPIIRFGLRAGGLRSRQVCLVAEYVLTLPKAKSVRPAEAHVVVMIAVRAARKGQAGRLRSRSVAEISKM